MALSANGANGDREKRAFCDCAMIINRAKLRAVRPAVLENQGVNWRLRRCPVYCLAITFVSYFNLKVKY